jgi:chemotaxis regulatin CheY-phosphate phosphatase CheZ
MPSINPSASSDVIDVEYDAIESALLKTARGRAFLGEFTRRNRQADTQTVLSAIEKLEGSMRVHDPVADVQRFRGDVLEMARRIADTRQQIVALRAEDDTDTTIGRAKGELDAIVQATESATSGILEAAEEIQEIAWTLREGGFAVETCEAIDERATNIYLACSFQDLTSQRIRKVIEAMHFLESRISQMIDIWGFSAEELAQPSSRSVVLDGPSPDGLKQDEVDIAMVDAQQAVIQSRALDFLGDDASDEVAAIETETVAIDESAMWPVESPVETPELATIETTIVAADVPIDQIEPPTASRVPPSHWPDDALLPAAQAIVAPQDDVLAQRLAPIENLSVRARLGEFE